MLHRLTACLALLLLVLLAAIDAPPLDAESTSPSLEPLVAGVAGRTVAIEVSREEEPPALAGLRGGRASFQLPQDTVDYYRRPPGPASGFLLDGEGNILTTYYNVSGTVRSVTVVLPGGERRPARVVAVDKSDDLALVRTLERPPALDVPSLRWAQTPSLRVGKMVIALGRAPDPERPTVTFGIVSALGRNGGRAFQTDAELNYGNVGGPITNLDGEVVGLRGVVGHKAPHSRGTGGAPRCAADSSRWSSGFRWEGRERSSPGASPAGPPPSRSARQPT